MANTIVARRYARALYQEAEQQGMTEAIDADVDLIRGSLEGSRDLVSFFRSPILSREKKEAVVRQLFAPPRVQPLTLDFLNLLIEKGREDLFPDVVAAYRELRDEQRGIVEARVRTAFALGADELRQLEAALARMTGKQVRLQVQHDPSLIGGLVVRVGDTVYDGSVRHQLANLREQLETGRISVN